MKEQTKGVETRTRESQGKRFLLGLLYWALLILVGVIAYFAESIVLGLILSVVLLIVYIIFPKRKGLWFWWWALMALVWVGWYTYCLIQS